MQVGISLKDVKRNLFYARWYSPIHALTFFPAMSGRVGF